MIFFLFLQESWIGSLMPFSALIGGIIGGPLIESIGRRTTILSTALPFTICKYTAYRCNNFEPRAFGLLNIEFHI